MDVVSVDMQPCLDALVRSSLSIKVIESRSLVKWACLRIEHKLFCYDLLVVLMWSSRSWLSQGQGIKFKCLDFYPEAGGRPSIKYILVVKCNIGCFMVINQIKWKFHVTSLLGKTLNFVTNWLRNGLFRHWQLSEKECAETYFKGLRNMLL